MKFLKFLVICAVSTFAMNAAAEITAQATIKITADDSEFGDAINLYQDATGTVKTSDIRNTFNEFYDVQVYVVEGSDNYSSYSAADLNGVTFKFEANPEETEYTISFSNVEGCDEYFLQKGDDATNLIPMTTDYGFTCEKSAEIIFTVVKQAAPQKDYTRENLTVDNWYTICVPGAVKAEDYASMMDVYTVGGYNAEKGLAVDLVSGDMEAGVPYIFQAKATQIAFNYIAESEVSNPVGGTNNLTGTFVETTTPAVAYVVANNKLNWAAAGTTVPAYRAYLNVADITELPIANNAPGRKFLPAPKGVVTGLDGAAINGMKNGKYIMNGRFMIVKDSKIINVLGL